MKERFPGIAERAGPKAGQEISVPAKKAVKFRIAKAAKDAIMKKK